jgi:hypothetical protein
MYSAPEQRAIPERVPQGSSPSWRAGRRNFIPEVLPLEDRSLPASPQVTTHLVLDFTPDLVAEDFAEDFRVRTPKGGVPKFLDFDGNGQVNSRDVRQAARRITKKVEQLLAPFAPLNLRVQSSDFVMDTQWGQEWLDRGSASATTQVAVLYVGGAIPGSGKTFGLAPLADEGYNVEDYGEIFSGAIARDLVRTKPNASSRHFVDLVASTIVHEFGHLMGLRHSTAVVPTNLMNANASPRPGLDCLVDSLVATVDGAPQNAFRELETSFRGQPNDPDITS